MQQQRRNQELTEVSQQQNESFGVVLKSQAAVNQSSQRVVKQEPPAAAAAVVDSAMSIRTQSGVQQSVTDFKENINKQQQQPLSSNSLKKRDSVKSSNTKKEGNTNLGIGEEQQRNTRNYVQHIQPVKLKVIKEPYAGRVLPTENNLATEEGLYNSFHFYGSGDANSRTGRQDQQQQLFDVLSSDGAELLKKQEKVDLLRPD